MAMTPQRIVQAQKPFGAKTGTRGK